MDLHPTRLHAASAPVKIQPGVSLAAAVAGLLALLFWRELGFPNLVLARTAKAEKRQRKLEE